MTTVGLGKDKASAHFTQDQTNDYITANGKLFCYNFCIGLDSKAD